MINYPDKPWYEGQTFNQNGVTYVYDEAKNCWHFSELTYNRLPPAIHLEIPVISSRLELEFSLDSDFETIAKAYYSLDEVSRNRMTLFHQPNAIFSQVPEDGKVSSLDFQVLALFPELDLAQRYFCRWRWVAQSGVVNGYYGAIYPSGGLFSVINPN